MTKYTIIGFDPASTRNIGWSRVVLSKAPSADGSNVEGWEGGTFTMPTTDERWQVLWPMFTTVEAFLAETKPELVIIEKTSSFSGGFVTGQVSQCIGVILAVCGKLDIEVEFVFPTTVKKEVAGHGRAKKSKVKKAAKQLLEDMGVKKVKFTSDHEADAVSNILCWLIKNNVVSRLEGND